MFKDAGMILVEETNIVPLPKQKMFKHAGMILVEEINIVPVPGYNNTKTSKSTCYAKYCHNWNSCKMCSHIKALAETLHILQSVMDKYSKGPLTVNATSMVDTNMSATRGKKEQNQRDKKRSIK